MNYFLRNHFVLAATLLAALCLAVVSVVVIYIFPPSGNPDDESSTAKVFIRGATFDVEVVKTPEGRKQGLSGREYLPELNGMLFIFEKPGSYSFWMKDMRFPIDILWLRDKRIVHLEKNVLPPAPETLDSEPKVYDPRTEVDMVLEVNAGMSDRAGISIGDEVILKL